jgi:hypothetical protein
MWSCCENFSVMNFVGCVWYAPGLVPTGWCYRQHSTKFNGSRMRNVPATCHHSFRRRWMASTLAWFIRMRFFPVGATWRRRSVLTDLTLYKNWRTASERKFKEFQYICWGKSWTMSDNVQRCALPPMKLTWVQWRTQDFFRWGGFNKFSWGQRTVRTGIWGR